MLDGGVASKSWGPEEQCLVERSCIHIPKLYILHPMHPL